MSLLAALFMLPGLVLGLTVHEFAHAYSASRLGDDFPRRQGRVSLNPFRHLSLLGTLAIFILPFGWGKPVQVNLYNFRRPKRDYLLSSLAGPAANLVVIAACFGLMQLTRRSYALGPGAAVWVDLAHVWLTFVALINAILATLNLLPIPPLDGSKIWPCIFPRLKPTFGSKRAWVFILLLVVLLTTDSIDPLFRLAIGTVESVLPAADSTRFDRHMEAAEQAEAGDRHARAEADYAAAIRLNPHSHEARAGRARAWVALADWQAALADINRAIELCDGRADYFELRAIVWHRLGRPTEAAADLEAAANLRAAAATQPAAATGTGTGSSSRARRNSSRTSRSTPTAAPLASRPTTRPGT